MKILNERFICGCIFFCGRLGGKLVFFLIFRFWGELFFDLFCGRFFFLLVFFSLVFFFGVFVGGLLLFFFWIFWLLIWLFKFIVGIFIDGFFLLLFVCIFWLLFWFFDFFIGFGFFLSLFLGGKFIIYIRFFKFCFVLVLLEMLNCRKL